VGVRACVRVEPVRRSPPRPPSAVRRPPSMSKGHAGEGGEPSCELICLDISHADACLPLGGFPGSLRAVEGSGWAGGVGDDSRPRRRRRRRRYTTCECASPLWPSCPGRARQARSPRTMPVRTDNRGLLSRCRGYFLSVVRLRVGGGVPHSFRQHPLRSAMLWSALPLAAAAPRTPRRARGAGGESRRRA